MQAKIRKENYVEKVSADFSHYYALENVDLLEEEIWNRGNISTCSAYAWMHSTDFPDVHYIWNT